MSVADQISISLLSKAMDGLWRRQEAISDNIANISTPYYSRKKVSFEENLKNVMDKGDPEGLPQKIDEVDIETEEETWQFYTADYNGIDFDEENLELARTTIQYQYAVRTLNDTFSRMKHIISEGRR